MFDCFNFANQRGGHGVVVVVGGADDIAIAIAIATGLGLGIGIGIGIGFSFFIRSGWYGGTHFYNCFLIDY